MSESPPSIDLANGPIAPALLRLVAPMLVGMLMIASVGIVDAYFIGELGTEALAAFGLCFPIVVLFQALLFGLANGITVSVARMRGQRAGAPLGRPEITLIRTAVLMGLGLASSLAVIGGLSGRFLFSAATDEAVLVDLAMLYYGPYLVAMVLLSVPVAITASMRGLGETRTTALVMTVGSVFNAGLDPVFMYGWGPLEPMGLAGVSIATVVAHGISACLALVLLRRALRRAMPQDDDPARDGDAGAAQETSGRAAFASIASVGVPAMLAQLLGPVASITIATLMARQGTAALAGLSIIQRVDLLIMMVAVATGAGLMPLVGQSWGRGDRLRAAQALSLSRRMLTVYAIGMGLLLNLAAGPLIAVFSDAPEVDAVVRVAFMLAPIGYIGAGLNISTMSCFNAIGSPMRATKLSFVFAVLLLPALASLGSSYGVVGIFGGAAAASVLSAIIGTYWMRLEGLTPAFQQGPVAKGC